jgi:hypothetical protein
MRPAAVAFPSLFSLTLSACGASPPPPPPAPAGPATWAELAPAVAAAPPAVEATRRYIVTLPGALPDNDTLESTLARSGLVADVGGLDDGHVVESQGVRCSVQPRPRLGDDVLPSPKIEPEYAKFGLTEADAVQIDAAPASVEIACKPSTSLILSAQVAIQVTHAVASLAKGFVYDPVLAIWYPQAAWEALRAERHFQAGAHILVEITGEGTHRALCTHGLFSFGAAEIALYPVEASVAEATAARLLVLADSVLQVERPAEGFASNLGPARYVFLSPTTYEAHAPKGPRPDTHAVTLILADPAGRPGTQAAVDALVHRLNAQ